MLLYKTYTRYFRTKNAKGDVMKAFYEKRNMDVVLYTRDAVTFPTHFHPAVEIIVILKGKAQCVIDGNTYTVSQGEAVVVFPNQIHSYNDIGTVDSAVLIFETSVLPEFKKTFKEFVSISPIVKKEVLEKSGFNKIMETALCEYHNSSQQLQKGWLLLLTGKLLEGCELTKHKSGGADVVADILNYCESNYHDKISLKSTARELHISESRLSHIFSEKIKIGFCNYLNMLRINEAANLLVSTELTITEISGMCGFSTIRTFNRAFKKYIGITPAKYRLENS